MTQQIDLASTPTQTVQIYQNLLHLQRGNGASRNKQRSCLSWCDLIECGSLSFGQNRFLSVYCWNLCEQIWCVVFLLLAWVGV